MTDGSENYPKAADGKPTALEAREGAPDGRRFSPSIARNLASVRQTYLSHMPTSGEVLEIASGTGEHGVSIAAVAPELVWVFSDIDADNRRSQCAWIEQASHARLRGPLNLNVLHAAWRKNEHPKQYDGLFCSNMIHIAPFEATTGLLEGAAGILKPGGRLMLYGPFARDGEIAPSNARFDADLKRRDPDWGVRDLDRDLVPIAENVGFALQTVVEMPANNLSVIFQRR